MTFAVAVGNGAFRRYVSTTANGTWIAPPRSASIDGCEAQCLDLRNCVALSYDATAKLCFLFSGMDTVRPANISWWLSVKRGAVLWTAWPLPEVFELPVVYGSTMYFGNAAADLLTGELIWAVDVTANVNDYPMVQERNSYICGFSSDSSFCIALNNSNGAELWKAPLNSSGLILSAMDDDHHLLVESPSDVSSLEIALLGISTEKGNVLWEETISPGWFLGFTGGMALVNTFRDANSGAGISAYNMSTGRLMWSRPLPLENWTLTDGAPYVVLWRGSIIVNFKRSSNVYSLDQTNGSVLWQKKLPDISCTGDLGLVWVSPDIVVFIGEASAFAIRYDDGEVAWRFQAGDLCSAGIVASDGVDNIYVSAGGFFPQCTALLGLNATSGEVLWEYVLDACPHSVFVWGGRLFVANLAYILTFVVSSNMLSMNYTTAEMQSMQLMSLQAVKVENRVDALLLLFSGNSTMQFLWL